MLPVVLSPTLDWLTHDDYLPVVSLLVAAGAIAYPYLARRCGGLEPRPLRVLLLASAALVVLVLSTGVFGGSTDEPFTTTRYAAQILSGQNPYSTQLVFTYTQCSGPTQSALVACASYTSRSYFVYLPLLPFLAIPLVPYTITSTLCWVGTLYLVRARPWALLALGAPYPALLAANGYNDWPGLLLLTLAFVGLSGPLRRVPEWLSLGTKQFANLIVAAYHLWRRNFAQFALTLAVSALWILPFFLNAPQAVLCGAVLHRSPDCAAESPLDVLTHINYWVWLLWGLAIFPTVGAAAGAGLRRTVRKLLRT